MLNSNIFVGSHIASASANVRGSFAVSSTPTATPNAKPKHTRTDSKTDVSFESVTKDKETDETIEKSEETAKNDTDSDVTKTEELRKEGEDKPMEEKILSAIAESVTTGRSKVWRHGTADCLACARTRPPSSHELREAFFAGEIFISFCTTSCWSKLKIKKKNMNAKSESEKENDSLILF